MELDLKEELAGFGANRDAVKVFGAATVEHLRYLDLLPRRHSRGQELLPSGVVEHGNQPLLYLVREDALAVAPEEQATQVRKLVRSLACRGEGTYLAVVRPGQLNISPVYLTTDAPDTIRVNVSEPRAPILIHDLATGNEWMSASDTTLPRRQKVAHAEIIHNLLFNLLTKVTEALRASEALSCTPDNDDVLPLVGRALFTRFLIDRGIINKLTFPQLYDREGPELCFSTPELAAMTCRWLDDKFNGELLPLARRAYVGFFRSVHRSDRNVLARLTDIMRRAPDGQMTFDLYWDGIDFAHVPVGVLSEVYEDYAHKFFNQDAKAESVRFTPRHLAEYTVNEAFEGISKSARHSARLLDPAAGAGAFLVLGFQRLVAERWRITNRRPNTVQIREILNRQICGFDINGSALTLAALGLYLTALELDPDPYPPEKLRFDQLLGNVLFNMRQEHERYPYSKPVLGSLGPAGSQPKYLGKFDIVFGNPPWTAWQGNAGKVLSTAVTKMVREIAKKRDKTGALADIAQGYEHNDMVPDIPFLWRAAEWARPGGVIALIVHGRILFKRAEKGASMRDALFRSLRVTGVLNGAALLRLWPHLNQPFCIVFARNEVPGTNDAFHFLTPELEYAPDGEFQMRIDSESTQPIELGMLAKKPFLLKTLFRGGRLDVELISRINDLVVPGPKDVEDVDDEGRTEFDSDTALPKAVRLGDYWTQERGLFFGQGYMPGTGMDAAPLLGLNGKHVTTGDAIGPFVDTTRLERFTERKVHRRRRLEIYHSPLVLIPESVKEDPQATRASLHIGRAALIFNRSYYGFSSAGHANRDDLARYLFALVSSNLFTYYVLQTSAKYGVERRTIYVEDVKDFPIIPFEALSSNQLKQLRLTIDRLQNEEKKAFHAMSRWVEDIYDLSIYDRKVIQDTLDTKMPFQAPLERSMTRATEREKRTFLELVEYILSPFFKNTSETVLIEEINVSVPSWVVFDICAAKGTTVNKRNLIPTSNAITGIALLLAKDEGASRMFQEIRAGHLRVAIRNQYRYLTETRARLLAVDVLREKGSVFSLKAA